VSDQSQTPPAQPAPGEATPQDVADVSQAVADAAAAAPNATQARQDAAAAARQAADKVNIELTEEQIAAISNGVVSALESRGAFEPPPEPLEAPPAPTVPDDPAQPAPGPPAPVDPGPRKRTFAQKFLGEL
jgi:hypothetical protein